MRVEALRLRQRFTEYYAGEGAADPVKIELPRGGYAVKAVYVDSEPKPQPRARAERAGGTPARNLARRAYRVGRRSARCSIVATGLLAAAAAGAGRGADRDARSRPRARTAPRSQWCRSRT